MSRVIALLLLLLATAACAGAPPVPRGPSRPPVVAPEVEVEPAVEHAFREVRPQAMFALTAGDRVRVEVQGEPALSVVRAVPSDGRFPIYLGPDRPAQVVEVLGMTPVVLEEIVTQAIRDQLDNAYVTVTVEESAKRFVFVSGAVASPQRYEITGTEGLNVLNAITMAGGHTDEADLHNVTVRRYFADRGESMASPPLDIENVRVSGDESDNLWLKPGDTVVVPSTTGREVHVLGHVEKPGAVRWHKGITLSAAVTECGGFKRFARVSYISIIREGETFYVDFDAILDGLEEDLILAPGDRIFVPEKLI